MNNLTELSKRVYQLQIEKGWCKPNEKRDIETLKILILSEAFEAFEAYRKNLYCGLTNTALSMELTYLNHYNEGRIDHNDLSKEKTITLFKQRVKDTFQDEIADVAIRALDLAGYLGLDFDKIEFDGISTFQYRVGSKITFPKMLSLLTTYVSDYTYTPSSNNRLLHWYEYKSTDQPTGTKFVLNLLSWCKSLSKGYNFDLMQHIELKLAYNKTRPFRHGNKVV